MTEMVYGTAHVRDDDPILPKWWRTIDKTSLLCILLLCAVGILLSLAASTTLAQRNGETPFHYVQKQTVFVGLGLVAMFVLSIMDPRTVRRLAILGFLAAFVALALLPVFGTNFGKGSVRWYALGFASLQPSEFLKPGFVVVSAWLIAASQDLNGPPGRLWSFMLALVVVTFLVFQPDFGQACLILFGWGVMFFLAGAPVILLASVAGMAVAAGTLAYRWSEHFARRIDGFLSAEIDPTTQLGFATNAIRQGGYFGVGVGQGEVKLSLPDAHTDFIIAVAAEEYGLVLVLLIIALYAAIVVRSFWRLRRERDPFIRLAGAGLAAMFGVQAMINMGVAVRLVPTKGMTLPFVSYGGSSMIASGIALGMLLALTRARPRSDVGDLLARR